MASISNELLLKAVLELFKVEENLHGFWWTAESIIQFLERRYDVCCSIDKNKLARIIKKIDNGNVELKKNLNPSGFYVHSKARSYTKQQQKNGSPKSSKHTLVCKTTNNHLPILPLDITEWTEMWKKNDFVSKKAGPYYSAIKHYTSRARRGGTRNSLTDIDTQLELLRQQHQEKQQKQQQQQQPNLLVDPSSSPTPRSNQNNLQTPAASQQTAGSTIVTPDPPPPPPPSTSFWKSNAARILFGPRPDQTTEQHLQDTIDLFLKVENDIRFVAQVVEGGEDTWEELNDYNRQRIMFKVRYLRVAYETMLSQKDTNGWSWGRCCDYSIEAHDKQGITTWSNARTIMDINKEFRRNHQFATPLRREKHVKFFALFPEGRNMLYQWGKSNLETLNSDGHNFQQCNWAPHTKSLPSRRITQSD